MANPNIADAKALAYRFRKKGVVIFFCDGEEFGVASYGVRRSDCDDMKRAADAIFDKFLEIQTPSQLHAIVTMELLGGPSNHNSREVKHG